MTKLIIITLGLLLVGCEERYRYPCQNPYNWNEEICKKPFCSSNGTCPEDLSHYLKEGENSKNPITQSKEFKGVCK
jgi:hypothetical protein